MSTIHYSHTTTATPEQFIAALTDFGPGRSKLFGNSADELPEGASPGPADADVTEGSGGVWERLHYDWSDPNRVVLTTTDSNRGEALRPHLHVHPTARRHDRGATPSTCARARTSRDGCSGSCSGPSARASWSKEFDKTIKAIEAGNAAATPANSGPQTTNTAS